MRSLMLRPRFGSLANVLDDMFNLSDFRSDLHGAYWPRVNIAENKDNVALTFELPGMDKKDIRVTVQNGVLTISGKREFKDEKKENGYYHSEIRTGEFSRSFTLPETVNTEKVQADYKNGMLEIKLDKLEEVKPKEIEVKIS